MSGLSGRVPERAVTTDQLTALLANKVMGWKVGPERFLMGGRKWLQRWRFQPTERMQDAFRLLEEAAPQAYSICGDDKGNIHVQVRIDGAVGEARETSIPGAVTYAVARAVGIEA